MDADAADDRWQGLTLDTTNTLSEGWIEPKYKRASFSAAEGRLRVTLNGGPDKRVSIAALRAFSL